MSGRYTSDSQFVVAHLEDIPAVVYPEVAEHDPTTGAADVDHGGRLKPYRIHSLAVVAHDDWHRVVAPVISLKFFFRVIPYYVLPHSELVRPCCWVKASLEVPDKHVAARIARQEPELVNIQAGHLPPTVQRTVAQLAYC